MKAFGLYFAELREKSGFKSQRELADISGVSHSTINRIEAGTHKANPDTLRILSGYLKGVSYEELMEKLGYLGHVNYSFKESMPPMVSDKPTVTYEIGNLKNAKDFIDNLDLNEKELLNKFIIELDGVPLTEDEIKRLIAFLRVDRVMRDQAK
ncbi:helix-turn-helix domain-containing protein [Paenibacillus elgii]|uniref:helix-turn-helix domain-containing protein n=1 Tax=Paenibacillus elgii TaxID=189691 RepID=UPI0013D13EB4|nr:helix-turn-helix transcriptional regulator [Paenibacillus elgii]